MTKIKGEKEGLCNRQACQSPDNVVFLNKATEKYYCSKCAKLINDANREYPETVKLFNDIILCRTDEGQTPAEYLHAKTVADLS